MIEVKADPENYSTNDNRFRFVFNDQTQKEFPGTTLTIMGSTKAGIFNSLTIYKNEEPITKLDFKYKYSSSSKFEAIKFNRFVAVGFSGYFYLYDLSDESIKLFIDFGGYFVQFKIFEKHLLIAYNSGVYCLTEYGDIKWHNGNIGIDGVILSEVKKGKLYGSGEIDPPDGWQDFILDIESGKQL